MFPAADNASGIPRTFNKCRGRATRVLFKIIVSAVVVDKIYARRGSWKQAAIRITKETNGGSRARARETDKNPGRDLIRNEFTVREMKWKKRKKKRNGRKKGRERGGGGKGSEKEETPRGRTNE